MKKALLVIDMQNDYLWDKRKPMFSYETDELVGNVNRAISSYKENGSDIIYIKHVLPKIMCGGAVFLLKEQPESSCSPVLTWFQI